MRASRPLRRTLSYRSGSLSYTDCSLNGNDAKDIPSMRTKRSYEGQLTARGLVIGIVGCIVITASSIYTALRMGALPWPIIFAAIISLFFLKVLGGGKASLNEANVTHTVMSSGAMVAGGLAFTIPGAWMLGLADRIDTVQLLTVAVAGVLLGLVCTALLRRHFIDDAGLEFPIGAAAAETLKAGEAPGGTGRKLFGAMGFAGLYALLRDGLGILPRMLAALPIPGVTFGIYNSPMSMAVGFLVGTGAVMVWFAGAMLANFGIIVGGSAAGLWDTASAQSIVASLGMGLMMGCGAAVIFRDILPKGFKSLRAARSRRQDAEGLVGLTAMSALPRRGASAAREAAACADDLSKRDLGGLALLAAIAALAICLLLGLSPAVSIIVVLLSFVTCAMSAQSVGQTGIDPMEIFGLIVLLLVALFAGVAGVQLFFIAAVVAVACGLAGDVMNDFKAGRVLGTSAKGQWIGQAIGGVIGACVAVAVLQVLLAAYGPDAFGPGAEFVSAQASVVATMVGGIPNVPAFIIGLVVGLVLYLVGFPAMMFGLGVYLPFYMSFTAFIGALIKLAYDAVCKRRDARLSEEERAARSSRQEENGLLIASGMLGGESIVGIILALAVAASAFA